MFEALGKAFGGAVELGRIVARHWMMIYSCTILGLVITVVVTQ